MPSILEWFLLAWVQIGLLLLVFAPFTLWMAGAIYFDVGRGTLFGKLLALGWIVGVVAMFCLWESRWQSLLAYVGIGCVFLLWWFSQKPRHDRDWDAAVAVLPRIERSGDTLTLLNLRNFEYRSLMDFTPRYETRTLNLANLKGLDLIFFNWGSPWMSHPVMVFDFGPDGRVCFSIEVRYRKGQKYSILRSLYRQQELFILVADERDVILRRTKHSPNQIGHLYRFHTGVEDIRTAFLDYVDAINLLHERPRWYHGLCANCTTTYYRLPHSRVRRDWRVLANGKLDLALYEDALLDQTLPFEKLRELALINEIANNAPAEGFSEHLRNEMERRRSV